MLSASATLAGSASPSPAACPLLRTPPWRRGAMASAPGAAARYPRRLRSMVPPPADAGADQQQPADDRDPADPGGNHVTLLGGDLHVADFQDVALGSVGEPFHEHIGPKTGDHDAGNDQRFHLTVRGCASVTSTCVPAGSTMSACFV